MAFIVLMYKGIINIYEYLFNCTNWKEGKRKGKDKRLVVKEYVDNLFNITSSQFSNSSLFIFFFCIISS